MPTINNLPPAITLTGTEILPLDQGGVTSQATVQQIANFTGTNAISIALQTTSSPVNVSDSAPPTVGQVLTATDSTHAIWENPVSLELATTTNPVNVSSAAAPTAGQVLTAVDPTHAIWENPATPPTPTWVIKNANYTAVAGDHIFADTSTGTFTITLPVLSANSDIRIVDYAGTFDINPLTIAPATGQKINAQAPNTTVTVSGKWQAVEAVGVDNIVGWRVF